MTGSVFRAVAPVSAVCAAFAAQSSAYPPEATKPDVAPTCGSAAKTKKEIKMSTEFYCEEFPTEQNSRQVQTLKDLLEACPEDLRERQAQKETACRRLAARQPAMDLSRDKNAEKMN